MPKSGQRILHALLGTRALGTVCALFLCIVLALMFSACATSFGKSEEERKEMRTAEERADELLYKLDAKCKLSYTKLAKVRKILQADAKRRMLLMKNSRGLSEEEAKKKMDRQARTVELELTGVLNEKELSAYKELAKEQKEKMQKRMSEFGQGGQGMGGKKTGGRRPGGM